MRAAKTPAAGAAQAMGILFGFGTLVVAVQALAGYTSLDPTTYTVFVLVLGAIALACGVASKTLRKHVNQAIRVGLVLELRGVPTRSRQPGAIDIGGVSFCDGLSWLRLVRTDALNVLSYVEIGSPVNGRLRVMVLSVNGQPFPRAERGVVAMPPGATIAGTTVPVAAARG
ncbi:MAG: hypothetical protein ABSB97_08530 [Thermoplasmata archaeon]